VCFRFHCLDDCCELDSKLRAPEKDASMVTFTSVTPNLLVQNVERSTSFYRDVLGFQIKETVPDKSPFVFVWLARDDVPVFLNDSKVVEQELASTAGRTFGGTVTMYFVIKGVDELHADVAPKVKVVTPLKTQFYGMREFAIEDPDGHLLTFAERVSQ
jgi:lactoylglutathione lyase